MLLYFLLLLLLILLMSQWYCLLLQYHHCCDCYYCCCCNLLCCWYYHWNFLHHWLYLQILEIHLLLFLPFLISVFSLIDIPVPVMIFVTNIYDSCWLFLHFVICYPGSFIIVQLYNCSLYLTSSFFLLFDLIFLSLFLSCCSSNSFSFNLDCSSPPLLSLPSFLLLCFPVFVVENQSICKYVCVHYFA